MARLLTRGATTLGIIGVLTVGALAPAAGAKPARTACDLLRPAQIARALGGGFQPGHAGRNPYSCDFDVTGKPPGGAYVETVLLSGKLATATFAEVTKERDASRVTHLGDRAYYLSGNQTVWVRKGRAAFYVSPRLFTRDVPHASKRQLISLARLAARRV
jgi:hypothetical protein